MKTTLLFKFRLQTSFIQIISLQVNKEKLIMTASLCFHVQCSCILVERKIESVSRLHCIDKYNDDCR